MRYGDRSHGSVYLPKLLGTYELEVASIVRELIGLQFATIVVAGAAEGYYAVGFARALPESRVVAFEASKAARDALLDLATRNGVGERVESRGICDARGLSSALDGPPPVLLVMDLDGAEAALLDPFVLPVLARVEMLVELHDCFIEGVGDLVSRRFAATHEVRRIAQRRRSAADFRAPWIPASFYGALEQAMSERRPAANDWIHLRPRDQAGGEG